MTSWWVDVTIETGQTRHSAELCLDIQQDLGPDATVGNTVPNGDLSMSNIIEAKTLPAAIRKMTDAAQTALAGRNLAFVVVAVDACTEAKLELRVDTPNYPNLVSGPEAATILGVNRQRLHQLATGHRDFPEPLYRLGVGSLWLRQSIETFARNWDRRPGRPRKTA